ncbi:hypothetical protein ACFFTK_17860 [Pseudonocardia petroleophila]|uniref:Transcriptional regulator, AbiEi antitoxin, Type IV TA system n=1 Tax=Pseudonocardia petroleophila TaxID=37331 RepID=A0A7G7MDL9_9PSEU|nr:hypothetical protein [Pseudonocardia petroleophila]QNG50880.1 hypothetical protein H6H00_22160 [Pseudonocardia petroleophila]
MRRRRGPDRAAIWAASRGGVITARALVALGVPESTVYHRCRDGGPWQRLAPGVLLLSTGQPTSDQLVVAALLHAGADAVLTGLEACRRHRIRRGPASGASLHLLVPHTRQVRNTWFLRIDRTRRLPHPVSRGGIPLAPVARAVADAARLLRSEREIAELISDAVQRNLCTVAQLVTELDAGGQHGSATPRRVLRDVRDGIRSAAELDAKKLWHRSGLPEPWWNAPVHDAAGRFLGIADAWWDDVALAWEINSYQWHLAPEDYAREQEKRARFTAAGAAILPTLPGRLRVQRREVTAELVASYRAAAARPRPPVTAEGPGARPR